MWRTLRGSGRADVGRGGHVSYSSTSLIEGSGVEERRYGRIKERPVSSASVLSRT